MSDEGNPDLKYEQKSVLQRFDFNQLEQELSAEKGVESLGDRVWRALLTPCFRGSLLIGVTVSTVVGVAYQLKTKRDPTKLIASTNLISSFISWKSCQYMRWLELKDANDARKAKLESYRQEMLEAKVAPEDQHEWMMRRLEKDIDQFARENPQLLKEHRVRVHF